MEVAAAWAFGVFQQPRRQGDAAESEGMNLLYLLNDGRYYNYGTVDLWICCVKN